MALVDEAVKADQIKVKSPNQHLKQWDAIGTAEGFRGPGSQDDTLPLRTSQQPRHGTLRNERSFVPGSSGRQEVATST